jgi:anti-sigma factor ChrR (cupin superfamily)
MDQPADLRPVVVDPETVAWKEGSPGVRVRTLFEDPETGAHTFLLEYLPGARSLLPGPHPNGEDLYVIRGTLLDDERACPVGTYVHYPPGSAHQPRSEEGCLCIVTVPGPGSYSR